MYFLLPWMMLQLHCYWKKLLIWILFPIKKGALDLSKLINGKKPIYSSLINVASKNNIAGDMKFESMLPYAICWSSYYLCWRCLLSCWKEFKADPFEFLTWIQRQVNCPLRWHDMHCHKRDSECGFVLLCFRNDEATTNDIDMIIELIVNLTMGKTDARYVTTSKQGMTFWPKIPPSHWDLWAHTGLQAKTNRQFLLKY